MTPFLRQVAAHYSSVAQVQDHCFVFPNRRSGQFFEKELSQQFTSPHIMPRVLTMSEWLEELSDLDTATSIDSLFTLYQAYREAFGQAASSFDRFVYWAHIILTDFNDLDMAMADADRLYANLNDLREIATDYIDPSLKTEIRRIFNLEFSESESFWKNARPDTAHPDSPSAQFFTLWEKLAEIYHRFHDLLGAQGLTTQGHHYRMLAGRIESMQASELGYRRVVMVGFTALSVSEDHIFKALSQKGVADFWWDDCSPAFDIEANQGGQLVRMFSQRYPSPVPLEPLGSDYDGQHIHAMAVPTAVGQAKWAFHLIDQMTLDPSVRLPDVQALHLPKIDADRAINTAIVLPDESLFVPLLSSVPASVKKLNVTLGYPMRHAGITSLMHIVARAHRRATLNKSTGQWAYFRDDVNDILSHPVVKAAFTGDVLRIAAEIDRSRDFNVAETAFRGTALQTLFTTIQTLDSKPEVLAYIDRLLAFLTTLDDKVRTRLTGAGDDQSDGRLPLQSAFIVKYAEALEQLRRAIDHSEHLPADDTTIFYLIDRITSAATVPFTGEPLEGLQVMGMLEARCLDFDNVVILSMNERIFPSRKPMSSFIPDYLRAAHLMPTNAWHEAVTTAHFYRLLSRAGHALLIYDSSAQGAASAEPSRYIAQLEMVCHKAVDTHIVDTRPDTPTELVIHVPKRPDMLEHYTRTGGEPRLSASAIKKYLRCPLLFYLRYVQHLSDDNRSSDFMDPATFGSVIHNTLQTLYYPDNHVGPHRVDAPMINEFEKSELSRIVRREVNSIYFRRPADQLDQPLRGDACILQETIENYVRGALHHDLRLIEEHGPIEVIECEVPHNIVLDVQGLKVNFTFTIDRLDRVGGTVRLIDYKTGTDHTQFSTVDSLLSTTDHHKHALMQLLLYCNALYQSDASFTAIEPMIYKLSDMAHSGMIFTAGRTSKQYRFTPTDDLNVSFLTRLKTVLAEMLDCSSPFTQTTATATCRWCRFAEFCRR